MKLSHYIYLYCMRATLSVLAVAAMASCVDDESLCVEDRPGYTEGHDVWLALSISNQGTAESHSLSRASATDDPSGHPDETASAAENHIDKNDLTLMFLDEDTYCIKTLSPSDITLTAVNADNGEYRVVTKINRSYFDFAGNSGNFYLLAIANTRGINRSDLAADPVGNGTFMKSLREISDMLRAFSFDGLISQDSASPWIPDIDGKRHIPMAGLQKMTVSKAQLDNASSPDNTIDLGEISMQRAMAKIRILDGIRFQDRLPSPTHIESVSFCSGTGKGAYMPSVSQCPTWAIGTATVETATKPSPVGAWHNALLNIPTRQHQFTDDADGKQYYAFSCYTPEAAVWDMRNSGTRPYLDIVTLSDDGERRNHTIYLDRVMPQRDMARNHIYQFTVTMSEQSVIELDYTVCEWNTVTSGDISFN